MSTAQILDELPKLSHAERRAIGRRLLELEAEQDALAFAAQAADLAFQELDRLEATHADKPAR